MQAIVILNSSHFERHFPIPESATPEDVQGALDALIEGGGLDAVVVDAPNVLTGTPARFVADAEDYADEAARELAAWKASHDD